MFNQITIQSMKRTKPYHPIRMKKQAVQMVAAGLLSEEQACQKFKISRRLLRQWQRWYDSFFLQPQTDPDPMAKKNLSDKEKIKQLLDQLKSTEQQLKYAQLKQEAYETAISIAEEELNIKITKKSGAGPPGPNRPTNEKQASFYWHRGTLRTVWPDSTSLLQSQQTTRYSARKRPTHAQETQETSGGAARRRHTETTISNRQLSKKAQY